MYEYSLEAPEAAPQLLMGRLSMLLDMALTPNNEFVIVCDRDEKIQVSRYPESYDIVAFCLGHQQFVTSISVLEQHQDRMVSVGGDGQLKLWDIRTGENLSSFDCWADARAVDSLQPFEQYCGTKEHKKILPPLKKVLSCGDIIVAIYSRVPYIHVLRCDGTALENLGGLHTEQPVWNACLNHNLALWILTPTLRLYQLAASGSHQEIKTNIADSIDDLVNPLKGALEPNSGLDILYKQWFDNVGDYLQRKKTREETKQQKKRKIAQMKEPLVA